MMWTLWSGRTPSEGVNPIGLTGPERPQGGVPEVPCKPGEAADSSSMILEHTDERQDLDVISTVGSER